MGAYTAMGPIIQKMVDGLQNLENAWRAQEAKILKTLHWCKNAAPDDDGTLTIVMERACTLIEKSETCRSVLILDTLKDIIRESNSPAIQGRAALCHARTDWDRALKHSDDNAVFVFSFDRDVRAEFEKQARHALDKIQPLEKLLYSPDEMTRKNAADALVKIGSSDPLPGRKVRDMFQAVAANDAAPTPARHEAQAYREKLLRLQNEATAALLHDLESAPRVSRPLLMDKNFGFKP